MRLQDVLKEREAEITALEQSLKESSRRPSLTETPLTSQAASVNGDATTSPSMSLSPKTINQFEELRHSIDPSDNGSVSDADESLDRLNELMRYGRKPSDTLVSHVRYRSMAQKESSHRDIVDKLNAELTQVRRQHDDLTLLSRDQV